MYHLHSETNFFRIQPYYITTKSDNDSEDFLDVLNSLFKVREDYFRSGAVSRKAKEEYIKTEEGLMVGTDFKT